MCENKTGIDSCGTCSNCSRIKKLVHPDIHLYFPKIAASDSGKYDKVLSEALPKFRTLVTRNPFCDLQEWVYAYGEENKNLLISREDSRQILKNVSMRPVEGGYKILLIWCPELMSTNASNAILKVLEEPPEKTLYLMVSYNYDVLLATIISRTQLVVIPPESEENIKNYLITQGVVEQQARHIARISEGRIGRALHHVGTTGSQKYLTFQQWMLECWNGDFVALVRRSENFSKSGKGTQKDDLTHSLLLIRNALIHSSGQTPISHSEDERSFITKYSEKLGQEKIEKIYTLINDTYTHLERNSNARITHLNLSLDIAQVLNG